MGSSFGDRLNQERRARTLTPAAVGGDLYPGHYISLLESGQREPTVELIRAVARRLRDSPRTQPPWVSVTEGDEEDYLVAALNAWRCWDVRDFSTATEYGRSAAALAGRDRNPEPWWTMSYLQAHTLLREGNFPQTHQVLAEVVDHPLTRADPALTRRTRQVMAAVLLGLGRIEEALEEAGHAVAQGPGTDPEDAAAYLLALQTLIGTLTEAGRIDEAWTHALTLRDALTASTPAQSAGEMHWVIGNVAFFRNDLATGVEHHAIAGTLFSPGADLARWAQFNKATAWARLTAGLVEAATLDAIESCEAAHAIVGASPAETLELSLLRARWHYLTGELTTALAQLGDVTRHQDQLGAHLAGDAVLLHGQVLQGLGREAEATAAFAQAGTLFAQAGAAARLIQAQEHLTQITALPRP